MDLRQLKYFLAVAQAGHMTRAAEQLGMQQPPLSQQIRALEAHLGLALFRRHPKGMALTAGGEQLLLEARRIVDDVAALEQRMAGVAQGVCGRLGVGFTSSAAAHAFTPEVLRACRSRFPDIALEISEDHAAGLTEAVAQGRLQCAFLRVPVARPAGVVLQTLLREPTVLAVPLDHPLAQRRKATPVRLAELDGERMILTRRPGAAGLYANLLALCDRQGVRPVVVAEVERMMTNLNLVAAGVGVAVVPASMAGMHAHAIWYRPLAANVPLDAPLTLAYREADLQGPLERFVALVRETAEPLARRTKAAGVPA
jgi:DNA-binding transcriptional LysR family regulator